MNKIKNEYVTVILPCYNVSRFISAALDSVINQTYKELVILCVDDGSTDDTFSMLCKYRNIDSRIILERNVKNEGLIFTLNRLVEMSNTRLIARMDPDDICFPNRIEELVKKQRLTNADVVSSSYQFIDEHAGQVKKPFLRLPQSDVSLKFVSLFNSPIAHAPCLYKKDFIIKYRYLEKWKATEDYDLWIRAIEDNIAIKFVNIDNYLYKYRIYSLSESNTKASIQVKNHILIATRARKSILSNAKRPDALFFSKYGICPNLNELNSFSRAVKDVYMCYEMFDKKYIVSVREKIEIYKYMSRYITYLIYVFTNHKDDYLGKIEFAIRGLKAYRLRYVFCFLLANVIPPKFLLSVNTLKLKES